MIVGQAVRAHALQTTARQPFAAHRDLDPHAAVDAGLYQPGRVRPGFVNQLYAHGPGAFLP